MAHLVRRCFGFITAEPLTPSEQLWVNELAEFAALRQQDAQLFALGLPHPWDLAGVETLPSFLSHLPSAQAPDFSELRRFLEATWMNSRSQTRASSTHSTPGAGPTPTSDLRASLEALHNIRQAVERELSQLFQRTDEPN